MCCNLSSLLCCHRHLGDPYCFPWFCVVASGRASPAGAEAVEHNCFGRLSSDMSSGTCCFGEGSCYPVRLLVGSVAIGELAAAVDVLGSAGCVGSCGGSCGVFVAAFSSAADV